MSHSPRPLLSLLAAALMLAATACTTTRTASVAPAPEAAPAAVSEADDETPETPPAEPPEEKTYDNTIKWSTASEVDNFGFDVYRGDGPDGPFERINAETIEGAGTVDEPSDYRFVDDTIDPHRTYYYYVESISMHGVRERFTPVGKAGPKIKPEAAKPEDAEAPKDAGGPA